MSLIYKGKRAEIVSKELVSSKNGIGLYKVMLSLSGTLNWKAHRPAYALLDEKNKFAVKGIYDGASKFTNGLALVIRNQKMGVINEKGEIILPIKYSAITSLSPKEYNANTVKSYLQNKATRQDLLILKTIKMEFPDNGILNVKKEIEWKEVSVAHAMDFGTDLQKTK